MNTKAIINTLDPKTWRRLMTHIDRCPNMRGLTQIHALFLTHGLSSNPFAISKLLAFCALSDPGDLSYASRIFRHFHSPNSFFYNTLIRAYSRSCHPHLSLHYFNLMLKDGSSGDRLVPDQHCFPFVLIACSKGKWLSEGRKVHGLVLKNGLGGSDGYVQTSLLRFYCGCSELRDARNVFDEIPERDVFNWNVLMDGCVKSGLSCEAFELFRDMLGSEIEPDVYCVTTAISACAHLGSLEQGRWVHEYLKRRVDLVLDDVVGTALVDMYAKCGCVDMAVKVFEGMTKRSVHCWAAFICGLSLHGYVMEAMSCLERMQVEDGVRPDNVCLLGVLVACTHAGYVEEGLCLLENMEIKYGVVPRHEHYSCVVDMLCKASRLDDALGIIRKMPMKPLASVWGALLTGSRIQKNVGFAELAVRELEDLSYGSVENAIYIELSNVYLAYGKTADARRVRRMIGNRGTKKTRGTSAVEVNGKVNEFVSGDTAHRQLTRIHETLSLFSSDLLHQSSEILMLDEAHM
ncbi:hypothetical protein vseg_021131 [Gypsophila vaccaria]